MSATVVDVCLALLLISGAAVTLVSVEERPAVSGDGHAGGRTDAAGDTLETLTTVTAPVSYRLGSRASARAAPGSVRVAHATLAGHLVRATLGAATLGERVLSPETTGYRVAVHRAIARTIGSGAQVRARWNPVPESELRGEFTVGARPPPDASVGAARIRLPVPVGATAASGNPEDGAGTDAAAIAVATLFPPDRIDAAARGDPPVPTYVEARYRHAGAALGVDAAAAFRTGGADAANRVLAAGLRASAGTGDTRAESSESAGSVTVVVRVWSP